MAANALVVIVSCLIEICVLRPAFFEGRLPHPVDWVASLINHLEIKLNRSEWSERRRYALGVLAISGVVLVSGGLGLLIEQGASRLSWGWVALSVLGSFGLAARNLYEHVAAILAPLQTSDIAHARKAVARIVGRDTATLDEAGVATAAMESLAESFCDGVLAPLFWFMIGGLAGLFVYKAVNTADSLIGHKEQRWRAFGWASARLDDVLNLVPARLSGFLIVIAAGARGWCVMLRDARRHKSPNGGWPEAALAGALRCKLGGPVCYDGIPSERAFIGDGTPPDASSLAAAMMIYVRANMLAMALIAGFGAGMWWR